MKKVLIIEDEKAIAELERDYLESYGFSVHIKEEEMSACRKRWRANSILLFWM